ncbi:g253 [Coccomyxa viridis]|uniref:G253 protein n=1 Tax=Coccomyxa viridis TaxID=1274662 RepID=A0ABP1FLU6_9CHLO
MFFYFGSSGGGQGVHRFGPPALFLLTILSTGWLSGPTAFFVLFLACCIGAWQVRQHGLWPTLRRAFITGWQVELDPRQQRRGQQRGRPAAPRPQSRKERFEQVTKEVHKLPMEEFVTREELRRCTLHELREKLLQRGISEKGIERGEAVERILGAEGSNTTSASCGICCEDYASGEVLRRLRCGHKFHLECIDRWFLSSLDYSRPVACPICNAPLSQQ